MTFLFLSFSFFLLLLTLKKKAWNIHPSCYFSIQHLILIFFFFLSSFLLAFQPTDPHTYPFRDAIREENTAGMHTPWLKENKESFGPLVPEKLTNVTFVFLEAIEKHLLKVCSLLALWHMKYISCPLEIHQSTSLFLSQPFLGNSTLYPLSHELFGVSEMLHIALYSTPTTLHKLAPLWALATDCSACGRQRALE